MSDYRQIQTQVYSQLQRKKQDQVHCNNSFGMLLSSMESFLIKSGYNISVLFGHYNHFNDISWKTKEEILSQLYTDLMAFKIQKMAYTQKYHKFDFPDYPPIKEVIKIVENWRDTTVNKDEKSLCNEILDLICDPNKRPISYYQDRVESCHSSSRVDVQKSLKMSNLIHDQIDMRNEEIKNEIEKNPNAKFGLVIGEEPGNTEFSHLKYNIDIENTDPSIKNLEDKIINLIKELSKKSEQLFKLNYTYLYEDLKKICANVKHYLNDYNKRFHNFNFLFSHFKLELELEKFDNYINNSENDKNKKEIFKEIKGIFSECLNNCYI